MLERSSLSAVASYDVVGVLASRMTSWLSPMAGYFFGPISTVFPCQILLLGRLVVDKVGGYLERKDAWRCRGGFLGWACSRKCWKEKNKTLVGFVLMIFEVLCTYEI